MTSERRPINFETLRLQTVDVQRALWYLAISARNMTAFSGDTLPDPEERELAISPTTTAAGFWNHFIGGAITVVDAQFNRAEATGSSVDPELVRTVQKRVVMLVSRWMEHPNGKGANQLGGDGVTKAFKAAALSFDWSEHPDLFGELRDCVYTLADVHMKLTGKKSL